MIFVRDEKITSFRDFVLEFKASDHAQKVAKTLFSLPTLAK